MFCSKCGRPVNENALFCTFCGNPLRGANESGTQGGAPGITAGSVPVSASISASAGDSAPIYGGGAPIPEPEKIPYHSDSVPVYGAAADTGSVPLKDSGAAYPETPPKSVPIIETASDNTLTSAAPAEIDNDEGFSFVPIDDIENAPQKVEKYYTFGHIAMCLAAVAVMAIVAGVFAGLYFSVV